MATRIQSHQLSNGLFVSGRPDTLHKERTPISSCPVPYTGGDLVSSGDLVKMFDIAADTSPKPPYSGPNSGPLTPYAKPATLSGSMCRLSLQPTGLITSDNAAETSPKPPRSGPNSGPLTPTTKPVTLSGSMCRLSSSTSGPFSLQPTGLITSNNAADTSPKPPRSGPNSGPLNLVAKPVTLSGSMCRLSSSSSGPFSLQPTGLITSGSLNSSGERPGLGPTRMSGRTPVHAEGPGLKKDGLGLAVTEVGTKERFGVKVSKTAMWVFVAVAAAGMLVGVFLTLVLKKAAILVVVVAVLVPMGAVVAWSYAWRRRAVLEYVRRYPDAKLRGAVDGQYVKIRGVVTCGSVPLESSFQKTPRCVYVTTELQEYRGCGGKSANTRHRWFSWGCRHSESYAADFYLSDFQTGLRALVKTGYGAKVSPFVKSTTVADKSGHNRQLTPSLLQWLDERNLSSDGRTMRLKEGYIKEGNTVSIMGVVKRHENVLMVVPPSEPVSTGCKWLRCLLPMYIEGLVLTCEDDQKSDVIPV